MDAKRIAEIEVELRAAIPNDEYDPHAYPPLLTGCQVCKGAADDHKANCYVPLVYELLEAVKQQPPTS